MEKAVDAMSFNAAMAAALLSGNKIQTRRPVFPQPVDGSSISNAVPPHKAADLIWVCEPFRTTWTEGSLGEPHVEPPVWFEAGGNPEDESNYLPDEKEPKELWREASRMTLRVTAVRMELLQDISKQDVLHEGFDSWSSFAFAWSTIYHSRGLGWDSNPWVWLYEFDVIFQNIDEVLEGGGSDGKEILVDITNLTAEEARDKVRAALTSLKTEVLTVSPPAEFIQMPVPSDRPSDATHYNPQYSLCWERQKEGSGKVCVYDPIKKDWGNPINRPGGRLIQM